MNLHVSILLATFNGESFLRDQLDSLLNQTYTDWKLFIHDDGSTDGSMAILNEYQHKYPSKIFIILDSKTFGSAKNNFFHLLDTVESDLYFFCDQDDYWFPDKLEIMIDSFYPFINSSLPVLIYSDAVISDSKLNQISPSLLTFQRTRHLSLFLRRSLPFRNTITGCTMCINHNAKLLSLFSTQYAVMHDWWIALIVSINNGIFIFHDVPLLHYRQHENNTIGASNNHWSKAVSFRFWYNQLAKYMMVRSTSLYSHIISYFFHYFRFLLK